MNSCEMTGPQALERLFAGNRKYSDGQLNVYPTKEDIYALKDEQNPFAAIIACADSRVPPNLLFGCSLGELFVVRNAGNVISDFELGSIEYAVAQLRVPLVMVLGHSNCGAVLSAMNAGKTTGALGKIMAEIAPSIEKAKAQTENIQEIAELAENYNIQHTLDKLKADPVLKDYPDTLMVGAKYDICTGKVSVIAK